MGVLKCNGYPGWILWDLKDENNNGKEEGKKSEEVQVTPEKERAKKIPVVIPSRGSRSKSDGFWGDTEPQHTLSQLMCHDNCY